MTNQGQQIITCKKCGSNKVTKVHPAVAMFFTAGCLFWIPIIGWIIGFIMLLGSLIMPFVSKKVPFKCEECKHITHVDKETAKQFAGALK